MNIQDKTPAFLEIEEESFYDFAYACFVGEDPQTIKECVEYAISQNEADLYQDQFQLLEKVSVLLKSEKKVKKEPKIALFNELSDKECALLNGVWRKPNTINIPSKTEKQISKAQKPYTPILYNRKALASQPNSWNAIEEEIQYLQELFPNIAKSNLLSAYYKKNRCLYSVVEYLSTLSESTQTKKQVEHKNDFESKEKHQKPKTNQPALKYVVGLPPQPAQSQNKSKSKINKIDRVVEPSIIKKSQSSTEDDSSSSSLNFEKNNKPFILDIEQQKIVSLLCEMFGYLELEKIQEISLNANSAESAVDMMLRHSENKIQKSNTIKKKSKWKKLEDTLLSNTPENKNYSVQSNSNKSYKKSPVESNYEYTQTFAKQNNTLQLKNSSANNTVNSSMLEKQNKAIQAAEDARLYVLSNNIYNEKWKHNIEANLEKRNQYFEKSVNSYSKRRNIGMGTGISAFYSEQGRSCDDNVKLWRIREAYGIIEKSKKAVNDKYFIDLHGLRLAEAVMIIRNELKLWYTNQVELYKKPRHELQIVTGLGSHSLKGKPVLFPVIQRILTAELYTYRTDKVNLSSRTLRQRAITRSGHGPELQEPTGYLFNRKPGEKYEKEGWENLWYYGFYGAMLYAGIGLYFKPDTRITSWARVQAEMRMAERGDDISYPRTEYKI
ncbi:hypothetical protein BB561_003780 [Smittium simulii]|uniref:NADH dehydrogenase [ubiquinone] 1 beta subcomplex subunit 11, mitochondrial n=1 Tax=Smittium simulii TaxID=133385 RepID=A0A2T9YJF6_9FUNG|nr:hypothetical protein BB561_003780 [Smittium simulii]